MNADDFEKELRERAAAHGLTPHDPTPAWKGDILARARQAAREADGTAGRKRPYWLLSTLGGLWCVIALLHFTTPRLPEAPSIATKAPEPEPVEAPQRSIFPTTPWSTLMALNSPTNTSEFP